MISAWGNLSTVNQSAVTAQMASTLTESATLQTNINDFQSKLGKFFNVKVHLFRIHPCIQI
jgi:hypothetical protein